MNRYGKITNGELILAQSFIIVNESTISNPSEDILLTNGYKPVIWTYGTGGTYETETNIIVEVDNGITLEERKEQLKAELRQVSFQTFGEMLFTAYRLNDGDAEKTAELQAIEQQMKTTRSWTLSRIDALSTIDSAMAFRIKEEDVEALKALLLPYM